MHKLGISLYPEHSTKEKDWAYMELAAKYGFSRIFTCLLSVTETREEIIERFTEFVSKAHEFGYEVSVDTNGEVFKLLGAKADDISVFANMGVDIIRLDVDLGLYGNVMVTQNPYNILIEFNGSGDTEIERLIRHGANPHNMIICHNFYPQRYTGLGWETFCKFNANWQKTGLRTAAFVSSHNTDTFGPWPVKAGLPTVEMHRDLPIDVQARHLLATGVIDDILIGNCFATEEELKALSEVNLNMPTFNIDLEEGVTEEELDVIYNFRHAGRGDAPDYILRSSWPRFKYRKPTESIPYRESVEVFKRGDVVIVNDNCKHYCGELQIVLKDMPNDGERNLAGRIPAHELCILDLVPASIPFGFLKK